MAFHIRIPVRFGDVDHARIVYYPRFINFFHVAFEELWQEELGMPYVEVLEIHRVGLPAVKVDVDFKSPARFGDVLEIEVQVDHIGSSSVRFLHLVRREGREEPIATARITTVAMHMDTYEKMPVPDWVRARLESYRARCARSSPGY